MDSDSKFASYEELESAVVEYQKTNYVQLYKRDSRTLEAVRKRTPRRNFNSSLKYGELTYHCIHGGRRFQTSSKGHRPNQFTFRQECQAHIRFGTSHDGQYLIVRNMDERHNHELSKTAFDHLPHQRRLDSEQKEKVKEMLSLKANKKLLRNHLQNSLGQVVHLKDLHNIAAAKISESAAREAKAKQPKEIPRAKTKPTTSQSQKFKRASLVTHKLASIVSESSTREFNSKIEVLEMLVKVWGSGGAVTWNTSNPAESQETEPISVQLQFVPDANNTTTDRSNIGLPAKRKRVRPKGTEQTVDGHSKKRKHDSLVSF